MRLVYSDLLCPQTNCRSFHVLQMFCGLKLKFLYLFWQCMMNMEIRQVLYQKLGFIGSDLIEQILESSQMKFFPKGTVILQEGNYVSVVPILMEGLLKVYTRQEEKELLLYYIKSYESCVMSFMAGIKDEKSRVFAECVEDTTLLLLPSDKVKFWIREYPGVNLLFFELFNQRYFELISTINVLLYEKLDKRVLEFLKIRASVTGKNPIKISHREIANELGSAREVVSRVLKKLEAEGLLSQNHEGISLN